MKNRRSWTCCLFVIVFMTQGCSNVSPGRQPRPIFPGLDESKVPTKTKESLAQAKTDFQMGKRGNPPEYAKFSSEDPFTRSKTYQGEGYTLTLVNDLRRHREGSEILIESTVTGGEPYRHEAIHEDFSWDD